MYSCVMSEFFELLEEPIPILEVHLSELLPLGAFDLFVSVLPEPRPQSFFELVVDGV